MKNGATVTPPTSTGPQTLLEWTGYDVIIETRKVCEADKLLDWVGLRVWTERSFICFQHFFSLTATPLQVSAVRTIKFGLSVLWEDVKKFSERQKMAARSASVREHTPRQLTGVGRPTSRFWPLQFEPKQVKSKRVTHHCFVFLFLLHSITNLCYKWIKQFLLVCCLAHISSCFSDLLTSATSESSSFRCVLFN